MDKYSRNQRVAIITKTLMENTNKIINLNTFTEMFNAAKSTISEDLFVVKDILNKLSMGRIETIAGAAGGVKYVCGLSAEQIKKFCDKLCIILQNRDRIVPGNFIYMSDVMCNPEIISKASIILASAFSDLDINCVVTVETKGIPLAYEVAKQLGTQLVVVRRDSRVTEGSTVSINYVSGSSGKIQSMSLSKKAIPKGSRCIFIDDFMKAGGTAVGIIDLLKEFESQIVGIGVLIDNIDTPKKLIHEYVSVVNFNGFDLAGEPVIVPSKLFK